MAVLDVTEYQNLAMDAAGRVVLVGKEPSVANQQLTIGAGAQTSAAFGDATMFVRIHTDAICRISFGTAPTASSTSMRMAAGATEYFGVRPGYKVSVITSA